jgi:Rieske Fe-S protein
MRSTVIALAAAASVLTAVPLLTSAAHADSTRLAQVDVGVNVGPRGPGVRVEERRRPDVVIERRRPGVVIEETNGRGRRDCVTRSESESRNGVTVTESQRECAR